MRRRSLLIGTLLGAPVAASAQVAGPLRVGADLAVVDSGLARALKDAFSRDTGIGIRVLSAPALPMLESLAAGELDVGLGNVPDAEVRLERQGLIHDRRAIADGEFVLVGPTPGRGPGSATGHDLAGALARWRAAVASDPARAVFLTADDGSGAHVVEQAAWRRARIAPAAPWYAAARAGASLLAQARARAAHAIVERGAWLAHGGAPLAVLVDGDPLAIEHVHAVRSFRSPHPAARLFVVWIAGARGRAVVATRRGYRAVAA